MFHRVARKKKKFMNSGCGRRAAKRAEPSRALQAEIFRMILRDFPDHPEAYNDLACLLWQTGRQEEALKILLKVMVIVPDHRDIIWNLGQFFKEMGRDREAFQVYRNYSLPSIRRSRRW
jgi:tetratricopeptide (TPR) repeat protein